MHAQVTKKKPSQILSSNVSCWYWLKNSWSRVSRAKFIYVNVLYLHLFCISVMCSLTMKCMKYAIIIFIIWIYIAPFKVSKAAVWNKEDKKMKQTKNRKQLEKCLGKMRLNHLKAIYHRQTYFDIFTRWLKNICYLQFLLCACHHYLPLSETCCGRKTLYFFCVVA